VNPIGAQQIAPRIPRNNSTLCPRTIVKPIEIATRRDLEKFLVHCLFFDFSQFV